ncbi:MAG: type II toxin-antitoxin system VapC family toxin [Vulcanimicrobiota bacterium]
MRIYFDTSAVVKLFVLEEGTDATIKVVSGPGELYLLSLARAEFHSAVQRRFRDGDLSATERTELLETFDNQINQEFIIQPTTDGVVSRALYLLERYPLRAYDALQLAGCLSLAKPKEIIFACADDRLLAAAGGEGLQTFNPLNP